MKDKNNPRAGSRLNQTHRGAEIFNLQEYKDFVGREIRLLQRQIVSVSVQFPKKDRKELADPMQEAANSLRMQLTMGLEKVFDGELIHQLKLAQTGLCSLNQLVYWATDLGCLSWDSMKSMEVRIASIQLALAYVLLKVSEHEPEQDRRERNSLQRN
jgi:hypothetical protein